jgi:hypothetical protein
MMCAASEEGQCATATPELERLQAQVRSQLGARVRDLRLVLRDNGVVLQGRAHTYYAKQLAQHMVMQAAKYPIRANVIEVD